MHDMTRHGRVPDFLVVGSMKCGTTSLHHYLSCHPQVWMARPKELCFFVGGPSREANDPPWGNWWRGEAWYRGHFRTDRRVCGEVSPAYVGAAWRSAAAERMHHLLPDARLVLLVREPMERLRSHYLMRRQDASVGTTTFAEYVADPAHADDVAYSDYGSQIAGLLERFPLESLLVVQSSDLDRRRDETLSRVFAFLGVESDHRSAAFARKLFEGRRRPVPGATGARILRSPLVRLAERFLPFTCHEALRRVLVIPFAVPVPDLTLPRKAEDALRARFHREVDLARRLTGLPLTSLGR